MGFVISPGDGIKTLTVAIHVVDPLFSAQADRQMGVDARCYEAIYDKLNDNVDSFMLASSFALEMA